MPHFLLSRPREGYCYLDFVDRWLWDAVYMQQDADTAYRWARELGHWAMQMHPDLSPVPRNVILGED